MTISFNQSERKKYPFRGVIEVRNRLYYKIPRILFSSTTPITEMTETDIQTLFMECGKTYPCLGDILEQQSKCDFWMDDPDFSNKAAQHLSSPLFGIFQEPDTGRER